MTIKAVVFHIITTIAIIIFSIIVPVETFSWEVDSIKPVDLNSINVLDLETAREIALAGNPTLAAANERVQQARQRVMQARSSYWPRLDATGGVTRVMLSENDYLAGPALVGAEDNSNTYRTGLSATWTLFNGFEREFSNLSARYGQEGSKEAYRDILRLLLFSVASSYYNAQLANENITIAEANKAFNERQLKEAKAKYKVGSGSLSDVLNFEVRINSAKAELIRARQSYEVALYGLAALMGIPDTRMPSHIELKKIEKETDDELTLPEIDLIIDYALKNRPDAIQMNYLFKQEEANVGSARAGFFPSINLSGSIDGDRVDDRGLEHEDFGKSIALSMSYNLFSGGFTRAKLHEAKSRKKEVQNNIASLELNIRSEVESALVRLKSAQEQLLLQRSNAELVERTRDLVEKEYKAGQASLVRLNEAQRDLVTAQSSLALSLASLRQAWENLKASTAQILPEEL